MQNRIRELRKSQKLTQTEFGARIGIKGNTVTGYETGLRVPSDAVILSICREFNVSEWWLRTGEGDMFVQRSRNEEIAAVINDVMADEDDSFRKRFIAALAELSPDQWKAIESFALRLVESRSDPPEK